MAALSAIPALASRSVVLRPLLPSDGEWCYTLMCGPAGERWRYRGRTPAPEVVAADLWRGVFAQFVVVDRRSGRAAGLVGFYNVSPEAARAHAFAVAEPDLAARVTEGFGLLLAWGFEHHGFARVFIETTEFNAVHFESLGEAAVVEGRLRNYEVWRGRYWDLLILSITPEAFSTRFEELLAARRAPGIDRTGSVEEFRDLVAERWPLDSLGAVEVLNALEELVGEPLDNDVVHGIDVNGPDDLATVLLERAAQAVGRAASPPVGSPSGPGASSRAAPSGPFRATPATPPPPHSMT